MSEIFVHIKNGKSKIYHKKFKNNLRNSRVSGDSVFKGYLHYKTITPQHVLSEAQVKNFLFCGKIMLRSQDIQVFSYPTI